MKSTIVALLPSLSGPNFVVKPLFKVIIVPSNTRLSRLLLPYKIICCIVCGVSKEKNAFFSISLLDGIQVPEKLAGSSYMLLQSASLKSFKHWPLPEVTVI